MLPGDDLVPDNKADIVEPPIQVSAALRVPPFWTNRPDLWFYQVETQFRLKGIKSTTTKYDYLISSLPEESMEIVADAIRSPPDDKDKYEHIKALLISRCQDTEEKRLDNLLNKVELGDMKPSELFRHMESLAGGNTLVNGPLLNKLWLNKMPVSIQSCLIAIEQSSTQEQIFKIADRIYDSADRPKISAVERKTESNFESQLANIAARLERIEMRQSRSGAFSPNFQRDSRPKFRSYSRSGNNSRSRQRDTSTKKICWYHKRYQERASKCNKPCSYGQGSDNSKN